MKRNIRLLTVVVPRQILRNTDRSDFLAQLLTRVFRSPSLSKTVQLLFGFEFSFPIRSGFFQSSYCTNPTSSGLLGTFQSSSPDSLLLCPSPWAPSDFLQVGCGSPPTAPSVSCSLNLIHMNLPRR